MTEAYDSVKSRTFATGTIADGFDGKWTKVEFALIGAVVVVVADCGYFNAGMPDVVDEAEAIWLLKRRPVSLRIKDIQAKG